MTDVSLHKALAPLPIKAGGECPVCGDQISIDEERGDGRFLGTCGDVFTRRSWETVNRINRFDAIRPFPIKRDGYFLPPTTIPWYLAEVACRQYAYRHGAEHTIECLAERGGFTWSELLDLLAGGDGDGQASLRLRVARGGK